MSYTELVEGLKSIDNFHKNLLLLFDDLVAQVKEKACSAVTLRDLTGPENSYAIWNSGNSEHRRVWIFQHGDRFRFVEMLAVTQDDHLKGNSGIYKKMCSQLGRHLKFPMLLIYGVFVPRDLNRFNNDNGVRRQWLLNSSLIDLNESHTYSDSDLNKLQFGERFTLESKENSNSYHCEYAIIEICDLTTITDSSKISIVADKILAI